MFHSGLKKWQGYLNFTSCLKYQSKKFQPANRKIPWRKWATSKVPVHFHKKAYQKDTYPGLLTNLILKVVSKGKYVVIILVENNVCLDLKFILDKIYC